MMKSTANQCVTPFAPELFMTALAKAAIGETPETQPAALDDTRLFGLLAATADRFPHRVAFADQPGRDRWSGRPRIAWTYANTRLIVERLAAFLSRLGLSPGAPVGICLPNGSEACVTILAVERAGYVPCLLPVGWSEEQLGQAAEAANLAAVISQGRIAEERPAEMFCRLAARYYGIRFVCAYGPQIPDGVIDLDRAILDTSAEPNTQEGGGIAGLVTFERRDGDVRPVFRPCRSAVAAALACLVPQRIAPGERILSLLPPDDLRGLTTGLVASLVTGATLEGHGLVDGQSLTHALEGDWPTHLVAPSWIEDTLEAANLPESIFSVVLVHEAPVRFKARGALHRAATDVLSFGELALLTRPRGPSGLLALSLDCPPEEESGMDELLAVRRDEDGTIRFRGSAAEIYEFSKGAPLLPTRPIRWRASGFRADLFAGTVVGIR
jgi:hypothetical protein